MTSVSNGTAIIQAYDFSQFERVRVIDVWGGHETLVAIIARAAPQARVRVLDLSHAIEGTKKCLTDEELAGRIEAVADSFLERVPGKIATNPGRPLMV